MEILGKNANCLCFLFPGQGVQYAGMGKDFYENYAISREIFEEASDVLGIDMKELCFENDERLDQTEFTQSALLTVEVAILSAVKEEGINPAVVAGLSLGEYGALVAAGAMKFEDAVRLVRTRGRLMQEAVPEGKGKMAAIVGAFVSEVEKICDEDDGIVDISNYNSRQQFVISGEADAVDRVMRLLRFSSKIIKELKVSVPSHCMLMKDAADKLSVEMDKVKFEKLNIPYVPNALAEYVNDINEVKPLLIEQMYSPVFWYQSVEKMVASGVDCFVEIGPGNTLKKLNSRICGEIPTYQCGTINDFKKLV